MEKQRNLVYGRCSNSHATRRNDFERERNFSGRDRTVSRTQSSNCLRCNEGCVRISGKRFTSGHPTVHINTFLFEQSKSQSSTLQVRSHRITLSISELEMAIKSILVIMAVGVSMVVNNVTAGVVPVAGLPATLPALPAAVPIAKVGPVLAHIDYDPHPHYSYGYDVHDTLTGDAKSQHESRNGDIVTGTYSLIEADGTRRIVDYTADPVNGFNAVVHREPVAVLKPIVKFAAPLPLVH